MDLAKIEKLMQLLRSYGMQDIEIKEGETQLRISQSQQPFPTQQASMPHGAPFMNTIFAQAQRPWEAPLSAEDQQAPKTAADGQKPKRDTKGSEVRSPFVGTYYAASAPGSEDFAHVGKRVRKGDTLCIVEAMKLMNEIEAERDGVIVEILARNEEPVEYDQVLFIME